MRFKASRSILTIDPYVPGKPIDEFKREYGISNPVKLASNENPFGFSPRVNDAVNGCLSGMNRYPDASGHELTRLLGEKYRVEPSNIILGNGSDDIINLLANAYLEPDDEALMPHPAFLMYDICVKTAGAVSVKVPLKAFAIDLESMAAHIGPKTRMVFITNPFNPTGSAITADEFSLFMAGVPEDVLVVVDEAYIEFATDPGVYNSLDPLRDDPRIVTLRTFSKAYGLAGFRVGYGIMDQEVCSILHRIRQPFNVNTLAQAAACAALSDNGFTAESIALIQEEVRFLSEELAALGYPVLPTQANFFMVDVKTDASGLFEKLLPMGVIVRSMASYGFPRHLRINAGTREENLVFLEKFKLATAR